jgi:hypothetical protein
MVVGGGGGVNGWLSGVGGGATLSRHKALGKFIIILVRPCCVCCHSLGPWMGVRCLPSPLLDPWPSHALGPCDVRKWSGEDPWEDAAACGWLWAAKASKTAVHGVTGLARMSGAAWKQRTVDASSLKPCLEDSAAVKLGPGTLATSRCVQGGCRPESGRSGLATHPCEVRLDCPLKSMAK